MLLLLSAVALANPVQVLTPGTHPSESVRPADGGPWTALHRDASGQWQATETQVTVERVRGDAGKLWQVSAEQAGTVLLLRGSELAAGPVSQAPSHYLDSAETGALHLGEGLYFTQRGGELFVTLSGTALGQLAEVQLSVHSDRGDQQLLFAPDLSKPPLPQVSLATDLDGDGRVDLLVHNPVDKRSTLWLSSLAVEGQVLGRAMDGVCETGC